MVLRSVDNGQGRRGHVYRLGLLSTVTPIWQANFLTDGSNYTWSWNGSAWASSPAGLTYTGASNKTMFDSTGTLTYGPNNVLGYSNTPGQSPVWGTASAPPVVSSLNSLPDPVGGNTASLVTFGAAQYTAIQANAQNTTVVGNVYVKSIWIKWVSGNTNLHLMHGAFASLFTPITVTPQWQQFYYVETATSVYEGVGVQDRNSSGWGSVQIYQGRISAMTYETFSSSYTTSNYTTAPRQGDNVITTSSAYYGPRFDYSYNGSSWVPAGLLVEPSSSGNLLKYSNTLETTAGVWNSIVSGAANTITTNSTVGPDGTSDASLLTFNTAVTGAGTYSLWRQNLLTTTNGTYTLSVWLKAGSLTATYIRFNDSSGGRGQTAVTLTSSWQWFTLTATTSGTITSIAVDIGADGNAGGTQSAGTVYVYGAQLEPGSFATSYIPTAAASVTRTADVVTPTTYAAKATIWQRKSESAGTTARTYYAPGALPSPFDTGYWYQSMAAYPRALTTAEQTPRLVNGAPY